MFLKSNWTIDIPEAEEFLTNAIDKTLPVHDIPLFENAEDPTESLTKTGLEEMVKKVGRGLTHRHELKEDDVILLYAKNHIMYPVVYLAALCAGAIWSGANPNAMPAELLKQLEIAKPKVIFTDLSTLPLVEKATELHDSIKPTIYLIEDKSRVGKHMYREHIEDLMDYGTLEWNKLKGRELLSKRVAVLAFSSGTTGPPKACMLSHYNLVANAEQKIYLDTLGMSNDERHNFPLTHRHCGFLPMYHATGMVITLHNNCRTGCPTYILSEFNLPKLIRAIRQHRITDLLVVPPVLIKLEKSGLDLSRVLSSVKRILSGAAPLTAEQADNLKKCLGRDDVSINQGWGMTEATAGVTVPFRGSFCRSGSSGFLMPNIVAKIIDSDGKGVGYGQEGEIFLRGPNIIMGYWKDEAATAATISKGGWLKTGDIVSVQPDGSINVVGRAKEIIKVKGFQVSPSELESALLESDLVRDCAVIKVVRNGFECPQAHVVPSSPNVTEADILSHMSKRLSSYKKLTGGVVFSYEIPKSPSGKILRRIIKDPLVEEKKRRSVL